MAERQHATLGGSSASRWMNCPGSVVLSEGVGDQTPGEHTSRGTAAHELLELSLSLGVEPETLRGHKFEADGREFEADDDLIIPVTVAYRYVSKLCEELGKDPILERWVSDESLPECGGFGDIFIENGDELITIDYKNGFKDVSAVENPQLMFYAFLYNIDLPFKRYRFAIIQPNSPGEPIDEWHCDRGTMEEFGRNVTDSVIDVSNARHNLDANRDLTLGDHCQYCAAKIKCPKQFAEFEDLVQLTETDPAELSVEQIGRLVSLRKVTEKFLDAVQEHADQRAMRGEEIPGCKVVQQFGNRKYRVSDDTLLRKLRSRGYGKKLVTVSKVLTPTQLEKAIDDPELIDQLTVREYKGMKLVPASARGTAVNPLEKLNEFTEVE